MWKLVPLPLMVVGAFALAALPADRALPAVAVAAPDPAGASADDTAAGRVSTGRETFWRGKRPRICLVDACPDARPIFCFIDRPARALTRLRRDGCEDRLKVRDAGRAPVDRQEG